MGPAGRARPRWKRDRCLGACIERGNEPRRPGGGAPGGEWHLGAAPGPLCSRSARRGPPDRGRCVWKRGRRLDGLQRDHTDRAGGHTPWGQWRLERAAATLCARPARRAPTGRRRPGRKRVCRLGALERGELDHPSCGAPGGRRLASAQDVSAAGRDAWFAKVAVDEDGNAVAVWQSPNGTYSFVQAAVRPAASGCRQTPHDLSADGQNAWGPAVAIDPPGNAIAVWQRLNGVNSIVQAAVRPAQTGAWQTPTNLSADGRDAWRPQVAVDPPGNAIAVWDRWNGATGIVQAAVRPVASGVWETPRTYRAPANTPSRRKSR